VICASCGAENREGARFCDVCGAALQQAVPPEQRKLVTILFCDVSGSTAFAESRDPEAVRAVMARYFDVARAAIERHGGTLEKFIGDAVMAVFGVPTVREDDALRAVRAAEELRSRVEIPVRIGVNTGAVVTGGGDALVTGDAVNVAARLEQAAAAGEVLLGAQTYALVRDAVSAELLEPLAAKGKSEPVAAYRLVEITGEVALARRLDAAFVGRSRERAFLTDAWDRCVSERACALFTVLGTAGVGKSRLASELLDDLDANIVRGRCLPYGDGITYFPVVEIVTQLLDGAPPPNPPIAALFGDGVSSAEDIALAVRRLIEEHARERPVVVLLDDVQWGEPTFLDLIEHVADWSREAPILLLCLARPDLLDLRSGWGGGKLNATTVLLEPLSLPETDELIDALLAGAELDPDVRDRIRSSADGNPLFVEQMLAMIEEAPGEVTVPPSIQALLAARLDQLPAPERAALERGAVEGQVFHRGAVAALVDDPDVSARLLGLVRKELVRPSAATLPGDEAFRFRHLLIRDAAYDALPKSTRATLHDRFALWLEEHAPGLVELDEILGYHLEQAARYRDELGTPDEALSRRAADRLASAGLRAQARDDDHAAASLLARAVSLLEGDPARLGLLTPLGQSLHVLGRLDESYRVLGEAIEQGDEDVSALAFFYMQYAAGHGESISGLELAAAIRGRLDELGETAGPRVRASGHAMLAQAHFWSGRLEDTVREAERATELARAAGESRTERKAGELLLGAWGHGETPFPELEQKLPGAAAAGLETRPVLAATIALQGRLDEARRIYQEFVDDMRARGQNIYALTHVMGLGWWEYLAGDAVASEALLRKGWVELGVVGERGFRSTIGAIFADVLARQGKLDEATSVVEETEAISTPDDFVTVQAAEAARAWICLGQGDVDVAVAHARRATEIADANEYVTIKVDAWMEYGEILLAVGRRPEAEAALARCRELAARKGSLLHSRRVDELLG
jgi:class 3 adenylate cyclase/tetratricopeptide (TPR) repeat protein